MSFLELGVINIHRINEDHLFLLTLFILPSHRIRISGNPSNLLNRELGASLCNWSYGSLILYHILHSDELSIQLQTNLLYQKIVGNSSATVIPKSDAK